MKKIYIVTSGEFSDYGIHEVFDLKEKAQKYIDSVGDMAKYEIFRIEEFNLN